MSNKLKFTTNYNVENAIYLAKLSCDAYKRKDRCESCIFESINDVVNGVKVDLQFFIKKVDNNINIVFKGSKELDDWHTNFKIKQQKFLDTETFVHSGFESSLKLFLETFKSSEKEIDGIKVKEIYNELLNNKETDYKFFIAGHSLGGAIATLLAAYLENNEVSKDKCVCYTFGAPPVGCKDFYKKFKDVNLYRIVNQFDPVPNINVFKLIPYLNALKHIGEQIKLPSDEFEHHLSTHYVKNLEEENIKGT